MIHRILTKSPRSLGLGALAVGACALALAACSSGGSPSDGATGTGTPTQNLTAHVLNLKSSDFPATWKTLPSTGGANVVRASMNQCIVDNHGPRPATSATSQNFLQSSSGQEVGSQVQVFNQDHQAASTATIAAGSAVSSCLAPLVKSGLASTVNTQETVTNVAVTSVDPHNSAPNAFAQQVVASISYVDKSEKQSTLDVYVLVEGFSHGPAAVVAEFENPGTAPSATLVASTMATLVKRAGA